MRLHLVRWLACFLCGLMTSDVFSAEPIRITSGQKELAPKQPQAAVSSSGDIHVVYGVGDVIFHCRSVDSGVTFQRP